MPRPLTAADREPKEGDVLIDTRRPYCELSVGDVWDFSDGKKVLFAGRPPWYSMRNAEWWHYISRADKGPVDTEAEE